MRVSMRIAPILVVLLSTAGIGRWAWAADTMVRGSALDDPELISGSWESDQFDCVVGLHIDLMTEIAGAPSSLVGVKQVFRGAVIQVYRRETPTRTMGDGNWFADNSPGVQWTGRHILIEHAAVAGTPAIHLNLIFDPVHSVWKGHLRRGTFDHDVTLIRPRPKTGIAKSPFVGTWYRGTSMNDCLHIVQTGEGTLAGWSDDLVTPGRLRYANGIRRPAETMEQYGSVALIQVTSPTALSLELKAFSPICCSIHSVLQLPAGMAAAKHSQTGFARFDEWRRVEGTTCAKEASESN